MSSIGLLILLCDLPVCRKIYACWCCCLPDWWTSVMSNDIVPHVTAVRVPMMNTKMMIRLYHWMVLNINEISSTVDYYSETLLKDKVH